MGGRWKNHQEPLASKKQKMPGAPAPRKAPPLMLQAQNSFVPPNAAGNFEDPPYLGTIPKFAPARRAALTGRQVAGGTELDSMPDSGPWLDQRFAGPCVGKKRVAWRIARDAQKVLCCAHPQNTSKTAVSSASPKYSNRGKVDD